MDTIILASASPRRKALLSQVGLPSIVMPQDVDESFAGNDPAAEAVRLAEKKVRACLGSGETGWVLGADTFIHFENKFIGKAETEKKPKTCSGSFPGRYTECLPGWPCTFRRVIQRIS